MSSETMGATSVSVATNAASFAEGGTSAITSVSESTNGIANLSQTIDYHPIFDAEFGVFDARVPLSAQEVLAMPEFVVEAEQTDIVPVDTQARQITAQDQEQLVTVRAELHALCDQSKLDEVTEVEEPVWEGLVLDTEMESRSLDAGISAEIRDFEDGEIEEPEERVEEAEASSEEESEKNDDEQEAEENEEQDEEKEDEDEDEEELADEETIQEGPIVDEQTNKKRWEYMAELAKKSTATNTKGEVSGDAMAEVLEMNATRLQSGILRRRVLIPGKKDDVSMPAAEDGTIAAIVKDLKGKQFATQTEALHTASQVVHNNTAVTVGYVGLERSATDLEVRKVMQGPFVQTKPVRHL